MSSSSSSLSLRLLLLLFIISPLSITSASTLTKASAVLADSGFHAMSDALLLPSPTDALDSLTVFAVSDSIVYASGDLRLAFVYYHISPIAVSPRTLLSYPIGARIKTLSSGEFLTVTDGPSDDGFVYLNGVPVSSNPIFHNGSLTIYKIEQVLTSESSHCSFAEAIQALIDHGCSKMASWMKRDPRLTCWARMTLFSPTDQALLNPMEEDARYFRRYMTRQYLPLDALTSLEEGSMLSSEARGFNINVSRNDGALVVNGVSVMVAEIYRSPRLIIHILNDVMDDPVCPINEESSIWWETVHMVTQYAFSIILMSSILIIWFILIAVLFTPFRHMLPEWLRAAISAQSFMTLLVPSNVSKTLMQAVGIIVKGKSKSVGSVAATVVKATCR